MGSLSTPSSGSRTPKSSGTKSIMTAEWCHELENEVAALQYQLELTTAQRDSAEVHVVFAMCENAVLRQQANCCVEKQAKRDRRIHTSAHIMTSDEGLQEAEREWAKCGEKESEDAKEGTKRCCGEGKLSSSNNKGCTNDICRISGHKE
ncbi:hypothetical protein C0992_002150 [Termitomyces sp. T32_za158]|nr:hypothetical protein C0992_002150 [Termitomyces sp. T32_za158]